MKAVRLYGIGDLRVEEVPSPKPGPGEVAIGVKAVGTCASDVHYYLHGGIGGLSAEEGFTLGHEFSGVIAEIGPPLPSHTSQPSPPASISGNLELRTWNSELSVGARVTAEPVRPCGACRECLRGDYHLCRTLRFFGTPPTPGAFCERVICPAEWVFPLPENVSLEEGAMMEPLAVGVYAAELAGLKGGETAGVVGCGAIGLATLQALKVCGASQVYAEDPLPNRRALAVTLGAEAEPPEPHTLDVVAECAGTLEALSRALEWVRPGGTVLVVGIPDEDVLTMPASVVRRKGLTLRFVRRYRHCFPRALLWTAEGKVQVRPFLTHRFRPEQTQEAFELAASRTEGVIRAWVDWT